MIRVWTIQWMNALRTLWLFYLTLSNLSYSFLLLLAPCNGFSGLKWGSELGWINGENWKLQMVMHTKMNVQCCSSSYSMVYSSIVRRTVLYYDYSRQNPCKNQKQKRWRPLFFGSFVGKTKRSFWLFLCFFRFLCFCNPRPLLAAVYQQKQAVPVRRAHR